jgi:hypothetical protein
MKKIILYPVFFIFLLLSCISEKGIAFSDIPQYKNDDGRKNFYTVDSIHIDSPIIVITKEGYEFTMSKRIFDTYNGRKNFFFSHPEVYLLKRHYPIGVPDETPDEIIGCYDYSKATLINKKGIKKTLSYKVEPDYFILALVNGDYYNYVYGGFHTPPILELKNMKFSYYKVVIPVCKQ